MRLRIFLFLSFLWLIGCPNPQRVLIGEYELSDSFRAVVPYVNGDTVKLASAQGQVIVFSVRRVSGWAEDEDFVCGMSGSREVPYIRYEYDSVILSSNYPQINIYMLLLPRDLGGDTLNRLYLRINFEYEISFFYDGSGFIERNDTYLADSLSFNGKTFYNLVYGDLLSAYLSDTSAVYFKALFYNKACGIVNLKMSDDEDFVCID